MRFKGWIIDSYRADGKIILWIKTNGHNVRIERPFRTSIYMDTEGEILLKRRRITYFLVKRMTYMRRWKRVLEIPIEDIRSYESFVNVLEKASRHRISLYNADIPPEQEYLYRNNLIPGMPVEVSDRIYPSDSDSYVTLRKSVLDIRVGLGKVMGASFDREDISGDEGNILNKIAENLKENNPDVIIMKDAFSKLPLLYDRMQSHGIPCNFHRWDPSPIRYKGGKAFFSYGRTRYKDLAVRLRGRLLVDSSSSVGRECDIDGILELCRLTGSRFQQAASRSFGSVFQQSLIRLMYQKGFLIPYKEKPVDIPLSAQDMLKADRGGHTFDAKVGFHKDVAEIDFISMYPWIIYNKNISADTILSDKEPLEKVPGISVTVSHAWRGLVPEAIKPIIDARMYYKKNPSSINRKRAAALKHVLVTAYGYLRFREFKLGIATGHMAICAYSREIILHTARMAEDRGFEVVHGIIDSIYIKKKGIREEDVLLLCREIESETGIPISFEGIFSWIVFLPSINDIDRPLPATYYGVFRNGEIKARGIEVRQKRSPEIVRHFQREVLRRISEKRTKKEIKEEAPSLCALIRKIIDNIEDIPKEHLILKRELSKTDYTINSSQKRIVEKLKKKGIKTLPGHTIEYLYQQGRAVLPDDFKGKVDRRYYRKLLVKSLFRIFQPLGFKKEVIEDLIYTERQKKLTEFRQIKHIFLPMKRDYDKHRGLSEREIRKHLERSGWEVWRGGAIDILSRPDIYPNIRRRYERLISLLEKENPDSIKHLKYLCNVHHGMPDFICYRNKEFRFIECKLMNEQLKNNQIACIKKLENLGFSTEVYKFAGPTTKVRRAYIDYRTKKRYVVARQLSLNGHLYKSKISQEGRI